VGDECSLVVLGGEVDQAAELVGVIDDLDRENGLFDEPALGFAHIAKIIALLIKVHLNLGYFDG
jgi:hypothetical protein